jgi:hypothetical protein
MYHITVNWWDAKQAYHLASKDGIKNWKNMGLAYTPMPDYIKYTDGTVNRWTKIERPGVVIEDGHVTHFTFGVIDVEKEAELGNDNHGSKVIVVPFDGLQFDIDNGGCGTTCSGGSGNGGAGGAAGGSAGSSGAAGSAQAGVGGTAGGAAGAGTGGVGGASASGGSDTGSGGASAGSGGLVATGGVGGTPSTPPAASGGGNAGVSSAGATSIGGSSAAPGAPDAAGCACEIGVLSRRRSAGSSFALLGAALLAWQRRPRRRR